MSRDSRMSFDEAFGLVPVLEAMQPRRRQRANEITTDSSSFYSRFPNAKRLGISF
jgi:hypothetical protein